MRGRLRDARRWEVGKGGRRVIDREREGGDGRGEGGKGREGRKKRQFISFRGIECHVHVCIRDCVCE